MGRKQTLIVYPHLNDCGGDPAGTWYVEYKYRIPNNPNIIKERIYKGLQKGTLQERYDIANKIISEKREWLESGKYLTGAGKTRVYMDELMYNNTARLYGKIKSELPTVRQNISEYLTFIKSLKTSVTYSNIQTKLRTFTAWLETHNLNIDVKNITRKNIIDFLTYLSNEMKLSRQTIKDYKQAIYNYFEYEIEKEIITINPVNRIPSLGQIVDKSAVPFTLEERKKMKEAIKSIDPQLWLACEIQYYCALRPGVELRLMKIKWIDFEKMQIRVPNEQAKNNQTEIVDIPDQLMTELIPLKNYGGNLFVFGNNKEPGLIPYGKNTLRNRFNRFRDDLGISKDKVFYSWKHTGAIQLIENGLQPYVLQEHLRHKNFDTTEKYLKKRIKNKEKRVSKFVTEI
ncbi:putative Site-specific recombinase XerD [uncultured Paludibacter sp.]|uniref:Putative Site-specific recombinase XerD n=1 Tax=uncultured Paludibacter sp. TaxID=497635 RepID=A0A653ABA9_9BACT|nr:putative Site-specific recombinase XerD [uncultured Paludibacter sp.]